MAPGLKHFKLLSSEHPLSCAIGLLYYGSMYYESMREFADGVLML